MVIRLTPKELRAHYEAQRRGRGGARMRRREIARKGTYRSRWRAIGACIECGRPCLPFTRCFRHRCINAAASKRYHLTRPRESA